MGGLSLWHWLIVGLIVLLLFGKGRFSDLMGDVAKGIKSFKKGMAEEDEPVQGSQPTPRLQAQAPIEPATDARLQPMKEDTRPHG